MEQDTKPIYTWDAKPSRRNLTAADIRSCKGVRKLTQTTANTVEEAAAAADSGIDILICGAFYFDRLKFWLNIYSLSLF